MKGLFTFAGALEIGKAHLAHGVEDLPGVVE